jgi:predicted metalloprotease with PDZ domain
MRPRCFLLCLLVLAAAVSGAAEPRLSLELSVDASEVFRRIVHAKMVLPVTPGPLTLYYPKWLPGEHGPTGPITDLAGLRISAGGTALAWRRDPADMYAFLCEVPTGATALEIALDFLGPPPSNEGFTSGASASTRLAVLSWNQFLVYPKGLAAADIEVTASLKLPAGWKLGASLPVASSSGATTKFRPVSLETLVDSPVLSGKHFRTVDLGPAEEPRHFLHIAAESRAALALKPETKAHLDRLVAETAALFGARHYGAYHFLLALSDNIAHFGLEHHESSDNRTDERTLIDEDKLNLNIDLLTHEMVHSWCGKHRRPADLLSPDFHQPMRSNLLWVYEGLTSYLGVVLAARSGLWTPERFRDELARYVDWASHQQGRTWRPLEDTAVAAQLLYEARWDWENWRRSVDFYDEGVLLWLEIDTLIREQTNGARSLDDFCRAFFGGQSGPPTVVPYSFEDIVQGLNAVAPYDWKSFLTRRVMTPVEPASLGSFKLGGWKLVYKPVRSAYQETREEDREVLDLTASLGLILQHDGLVKDLVPGGAADKEGLAPGVKVLAVNGLHFSEARLRDAIAAKQPVELLVQSAEAFQTHKLDYRGGERYPHLEQDAEQLDLLSPILAARTPASPPKEGKPDQ